MHCGLVILGYSTRRKCDSCYWSLCCLSFIFWLQTHILNRCWLHYMLRKTSTNLKHCRYTIPSAFIVSFFFSTPSLTDSGQNKSCFESTPSLLLRYLKLSVFSLLSLIGCSVLVLSSVGDNLDFSQARLFKKRKAYTVCMGLEYTGNTFISHSQSSPKRENCT